MSLNLDDQIYSLIGDVGGTNTRLQLVAYNRKSDSPCELKTQFYRTQDHKSLSECIANFLQEFKGTGKYPRNATLAVAGAPYEGRVFLTNTHWPTLDEKELEKEFQIQPFVLINDFVAIGFAVPKVLPEHCIALQEAKCLPRATKVVAGPGTGMGECILQPCHCKGGGVSYNAFGTEGGHKNFAPNSPTEWEYLNFVITEMPEFIEKFGYLSTEKAFCGPGIPNIHRFFSKKQNITYEKLTSEEIIKRGLSKQDALCLQTLEFFVTLYAKEIADFALNSLPYGGIFLVGGLTNAISDYLLNDPSCPFKKSYLSKGKTINQLLERFPIYIVKEKELGLLGAFVKAQKDSTKSARFCMME